jgi:hypothetical protein
MKPRRTCALPGPVYVKKGGTWTKSSITKAHCGRFVEAAMLKDGRRKVMVAVIEVRGVKYAVPSPQHRTKVYPSTRL